MDKREKSESNLWNTIKSFFAAEGNSKDFEKELEDIQKVQKQVHAEREDFVASLRVDTTGGKAKKSRVIKKEQRSIEIERGE